MLLDGHCLEGAQQKRGYKRWGPAIIGVASIAGLEVLPTDDGDSVTGANAGVSEQIGERRRGVARLPHQAEWLVEDDIQGKARDLGVDQPFVANHENTKVVGTKEQERLFEPSGQTL